MATAVELLAQKCADLIAEKTLERANQPDSGANPDTCCVFIAKPLWRELLAAASEPDDPRARQVLADLRLGMSRAKPEGEVGIQAKDVLLVVGLQQHAARQPGPLESE